MEQGSYQSSRSSDWALLAGEDRGSVVLEVEGLDPASIDWTNQPRLLWQSILEDAENRGRVPQIIEVALKRYPENQSFLLAKKNQLRFAVSALDIRDQDWQGPTTGESLEKIMGRVSTLRAHLVSRKGA